MPTSAAQKQPALDSDAELADFSLEPDEVAKGAQAVASYLGSIRVEEHRQFAETALDKLALLISSGRCEAVEFPWHQLEGHHGAAALVLLKGEGVPETIERYFCQRDQERRSPRPPLVYPTREIQKIRNTLRKVLNESSELGHVNSPSPGCAADLLTPAGNTVLRGRMLTAGEFRALLESCYRDESACGHRDALILYLGYEGGLRLGEMLSVALADIGFESRSGRLAVTVRGSRGPKPRKVPLSNNAMIVLEDWLEKRGREAGALLCPVRARGRIDIKRMQGVDLRRVCTRRAQEAGVGLFSPQDLRRRVAAGGVVHEAPMQSKLFPGEEITAEGGAIERIAFPYPMRKSE